MIKTGPRIAFVRSVKICDVVVPTRGRGFWLWYFMLRLLLPPPSLSGCRVALGSGCGFQACKAFADSVGNHCVLRLLLPPSPFLVVALRSVPDTGFTACKAFADRIGNKRRRFHGTKRSSTCTFFRTHVVSALFGAARRCCGVDNTTHELVLRTRRRLLRYYL